MILPTYVRRDCNTSQPTSIQSLPPPPLQHTKKNMTDAPPSPPPSEPQPQPQPQPQPSHDDAASPKTVPEGLRATQLRKVFVRALSKSVGTCTYDNFAACFPTTAHNQPRLLQALWKQVIELWRTRAMVCCLLSLPSPFRPSFFSGLTAREGPGIERI